MSPDQIYRQLSPTLRLKISKHKTYDETEKPDSKNSQKN